MVTLGVSTVNKISVTRICPVFVEKLEFPFDYDTKYTSFALCDWSGNCSYEIIQFRHGSLTTLQLEGEYPVRTLVSVSSDSNGISYARKAMMLCGLFSHKTRGLRSRCFTENDVRLSYVTYECL